MLRLPISPGGGKGVLKAGEQVRVTDQQYDPRPIVFSAQPVNRPTSSSDLFRLMNVQIPNINGFSLSLETMELNKTLKLIHEDP